MDMIEEDFQSSDWKKKCAEATKNGYESKSPRREPRAVANASAASAQAAVAAAPEPTGMDMIEEDFQLSNWKKKCAEATKSGYESKSPRREPRAVANASANAAAATEAAVAAAPEPTGMDVIAEDFKSSDWRKKMTP